MGGTFSNDYWNKIKNERIEVKNQIDKVLDDKQNKSYFIIETVLSENTRSCDDKSIENMELIVSYLLSTKKYVIKGGINSTVIPVGRNVKCIYRQVILKI